VQELNDSYIPLSKMGEVMALLQDGDFVNVMVGHGPAGVWSTHTGLIVRGQDGTANFLHSTTPKVREEPLQDYIDRYAEKGRKQAANPPKDEKDKKPLLYGFKILRLREDAQKNLASLQ